MSEVSYAFERYEFVRREPSDVQEFLPTLIELVVGIGARKIIELGVRWGVSTATFLWALEQTDGHLWSVDADSRCAFKDDRWTFIEGYDIDIGVLDQLPSDADVVFIDTEARSSLKRVEIETYRSRVRPGGVMVFTDTEVEFGVGEDADVRYPVLRIIDELLPESTHPRSRFTSGRGLVIVGL